MIKSIVVMQHILITRPIDQAQELKAILEDAGNQVFIEPLFSIKKHSIHDLDCSNVGAVIITSANACHALIDSQLDKQTLIFAVGKKTARDLVKYGFTNITYAPEMSAVSLKQKILAANFDQNREIIYFHGSTITLDFKEELKMFKIRDILAYSTVEIANFSKNLLEICQKSHNFDQILLFSKKSAAIFYNMLQKHNLLEYFSNAQIVCLSEKILHDVKAFGFSNVITFDEVPILKRFYD